MTCTVSLLTIVRGRRAHLDNLLRGVARQTQPPEEVIVVHMNEVPPTGLADPGVMLRQEQVWDAEHTLPLARSRNTAAAAAQSELLLFLDVDCIPGPTYVEDMVTAIERSRGLVMGDVRYLPADTAPANWALADLEAAAIPHPRRPLTEPRELLFMREYHLFWSLSFGLFKKDFERLGGFDTRFRGYGGEDTDFAFTARKAKLPFYVYGTPVYHQHHATHTPPLNHLQDIVVNARAFHRKWGHWPMEGWLNEFEQRGYVRWTEDELEVLQLPDDKTIAATRSDTVFA